MKRWLPVLALFLIWGESLSPANPTPASFTADSLSKTTSPELLLSPRLASLQRELARADQKVLKEFWQEIEGCGTPLVEQTGNGEAYVYVTFLWRGTKETKNAVVLTLDNSQLANAEYFAQAQMANLPTTDVWFKTYRLRNDARFSYRIAENIQMALLSELNPNERAHHIGAFKADPLNPKHYMSRNGDSSVVELQAAPHQTWIVEQSGIPKGKVEKQTFHSQILNNDRTLWIYTPPGYSSSQAPNKLLVTLDGETYISEIPVPIILDNLIAKSRLPQTVAVMVGNAEGARMRELWYNEPFATFLTKELIPWLRQRYRVSSKPDEHVIAGSSLGSNAAVFIGLFHPETFGKVLAQSGGFMYRHQQSQMVNLRNPGELLEENFPESEWLTRQFTLRPKQPLRFYLEVGLLEDVIWREVPPRYAYPSLLLATRHLRDVLQAKGYGVCYHEFDGAHETLSWRGTFADGLMALIGTGCDAQ